MIDIQGSTPISTHLPAALGRFQIVRKLGEGTQSVVYLAFDPQLHREVAVKVFRGQADNADALLNEARAVSRLSHAAIIPVFEAAHDAQEGVAYLVFEYVAGPTLAEVLHQQGALEPLLVVKMLLPVLDAVAYAHANGVIHRDLKPSNILMDRRGMARVMDFGVAVRQLESAPKAAHGLDDDDDENLPAPVGTPAYMAPEYIQYGRVSPQMDVFSVGLVLFEMLAGQRAVPAGTGLQALHFLVNNDIVLPTVLRYQVNEGMRTMLRRALARNPASRYLRMADFEAALQNWSKFQSERSDHPDEAQGFGGAHDGAAAAERAITLEGLLRRIRLKGELPALPTSRAEISKLTALDPSDMTVLKAAVLQDVAVTQSLLRMVNSAMYLSFGGGTITTVSRAVQLLGCGAVRTVVNGLPSLDLNTDPTQAGRILDEIALAHFCGAMARSMSGMSDRAAEEAFVCGSVHRLGRLLVACYFTDEAAEIERMNLQDPAHSAQVVPQVLGLSYEALGLGVAKQWGLPEAILRSMRATDAVSHADDTVALATPSTWTETLQALSACAAELTKAWAYEAPERQQATIVRTSQRFANVISTTPREIQAALDAAEVAVKSQLTSIGQDLSRSKVAVRLGLATRPLALANDTRGQTYPDAPNATPAFTGKSTPAYSIALAQATRTDSFCRDILTGAIQDLAGTLLEPYKLNDVVLNVLNVFLRAADFRQVIFCVRDAKTNTMIGRLAVGTSASGNKDPGRLRIHLDDLTDLLALATIKGQDLWISDTLRAPAGLQLTAHFCQTMIATSVLLLPLHLKGQPLGLFYADWSDIAHPLFSDKDMALMVTLRNQVALAFRQRAF